MKFLEFFFKYNKSMDFLTKINLEWGYLLKMRVKTMIETTKVSKFYYNYYKK